MPWDQWLARGAPVTETFHSDGLIFLPPSWPAFALASILASSPIVILTLFLPLALYSQFLFWVLLACESWGIFPHGDLIWLPLWLSAMLHQEKTSHLCFSLSELSPWLWPLEGMLIALPLPCQYIQHKKIWTISGVLYPSLAYPLPYHKGISVNWSIFIEKG